jgi:hypothetical protein
LLGSKRDLYFSDSDNFKKIPGNPIAYWLNEIVFDIFKYNKRIGDYSKPLAGICTGNNDKYFRVRI